MGQEIGLAKWLSMAAKDQRAYLKKAEEDKAQELASLSYEEALRRTHELLRLAESLPLAAERHDCPIGFGRLL